MPRIRLFPPRSRRFRLGDVIILVALLALPLAAIGTVLRANLSPEAQLAFIVIALAAPVIVGVLWLLTEPGVLRSKWGEGPASVLYVGLTLVSILLVIILYFLHPVGALLVGAEMIGFLAYLLTWL